MSKLSEVCKAEYFQSEEIIEKFTRFYNSTKITNKMLNEIEEIFQECKNLPKVMEQKEKEATQIKNRKAQNIHYLK